MDYSANLKKTILISLLWHCAILGIFTLTFSKMIPELRYTSVSFLGNILSRAEFADKGDKTGQNGKRIYITQTGLMLAYKNPQASPIFSAECCQKPPAVNVLNLNKGVFEAEPRALPYLAKRKESAITIHPMLPEHFNLYFKDRQTVHIELEFNIANTTDKTGSIAVKRKISSGNLEVDLLAMRYIGHYLFLQQPGFASNPRRTIKIDLSNKND